MRHGMCIMICLVLAAIAAGCATPPTQTPASDTRETDIQAVRDVEAVYLKALEDRDIEKYFSYFSDDAWGLYPGSAIREGKLAIRSWVEPMFADPGFTFTMKPSRIEASKEGDIVYSIGAYVATFTEESTKKVKSENGKYLTVFRKQADGGWKVEADAAIADPAM